MKKIYNKFKNLPRKMRMEVIIAIILTVVATITVPVFAWFTNYKKLGDLERIDTPIKLYITAAHDDIKYLQLTDIQVSDSVEKKKYYVFAVSGKSASYYNLQLAYTTNNQFEYFIYPAKQVSASDEYMVKYTAHDENGIETDTYYYTIEKDSSINEPHNAFTGDANYRLWSGTIISNDSQAVTTRFVNKDNDSDLIANSSKHNATYDYKNYDGANENNVGAQLYSEPVYWQALRIKSGMDASNTFDNYYILEVNWEKAAEAASATGGLKDDKETDIIYISAEATS